MSIDDAVQIIRMETGCDQDRAEYCAYALLDAGLLNASNLSDGEARQR